MPLPSLRVIFSTVAILPVILFNFWIFWIFQYNFFLGELLVIESVLLYLSSYIKRNFFVSVLIIILLVLSGVFVLLKHFDYTAFSLSTMDSIKIMERQEYFAKELGPVYKNKIGILYFNNLRLSFRKISDNLFSAVDFGLYFSPAPLADQAKFPLIFAPIFLTGLVLLVKDFKIIHFAYLILALFITSVTKADYKIGPMLMFPFIALCISTGFHRILSKISKIFT